MAGCWLPAAGAAGAGLAPVDTNRPVADHGPRLPLASTRRTRQTYCEPLAGMGLSGAKAAVSTLPVRIRFVLEKASSLFL